MSPFSRRLGFVCTGASLFFGAGASDQDAQPCQSGAPRGSKPFQLANIDSLVGVFEFVLVQTTPREWADTTRGRLELWRQDSAKVWHNPSGGLAKDSASRARVARYVGGAFVVQPADTNYWWRRMASRDRKYPGVEWYLGRLRFGDRDVLDGTGEDVTVEWVAPGQFGGRWRRDLGIAVIVSPEGKAYPNPEGYFCARRLGA